MLGCDLLDQQNEPVPGPPLVHVVAANVGVSEPLPQDGVIAVAFDRYLNPGTVNRQGVELRDEFGNAPDSPLVDYDPVTRIVRLSNQNPGQTWLTIGTPYELIFPVATDEAGSFGLRAIDNATIDPNQPNIGFSITAPTGNPPVDPKIDFCADVFPLFAANRPGTAARGLCSNGACHGVQSGTPNLGAAQGLVLETEDGIRYTALGVEALETTTASSSGATSPEPTFPSGMPIIDPGNPGDSYLLYKLLLPSAGPTASTPYAYSLACATPQTPPFDPLAVLASPDEAQRLATHVVGARMPWGDLDSTGSNFVYPGTSLAVSDLEKIRLWISQGAAVDDCTACPATAQ